MNESAFPLSGDWSQIKDKGMTLRDYFAAKVIEQCVDHTSTLTRAAEEAYKIADAMMEARK